MSFSTPSSSSKLRSTNRSKSRSSLGTSTPINSFNSTPQSQSRSAFSSSNYRPSTPSSLSNVKPHKNSIPYHLLASSPANSSPSQTPFNPSAPFNPASSYNNFNPNSSSSSPVFRRNAPFGSPGSSVRSPARSNAGPGGLNQRLRQESVGVGNGVLDGNSPRTNRSARFIRKKPFKERILSLPSDIYQSASLSLSLYLSELLYVPNNAYILSIFLHSLSLISCILSPDVSLGFGLPTFGSSYSRDKPKAMFGRGSNRDGLRGIAKDQMDVGWRGISFLLALVALGLSLYTACSVSSATKSYTLWMREADHKLSASSSRLVDVPSLSEEEEGESLQEQFISFLLKCLKSLCRQIPVVNWFIPSDSDSRSDNDQGSNPKMISIQVWDPNEVLLRTCCLYSPLHSFVYLLLLSPLPISSGLSPAPNTPLGWVLLLSLMALGSAQTLVLCLWFKEREKDKATLAGEVMFEYEQKFVIPRALPAVRDVSTMTSQAEFINPSDWQTTPYSSSRAKGKSNPVSSRNRYDSSFEDQSLNLARGGSEDEI